MVDKDFARISALELMFPDVLINICHFYINRPFRDFFVKKCPQMLILRYWIHSWLRYIQSQLRSHVLFLLKKG